MTEANSGGYFSPRCDWVKDLTFFFVLPGVHPFRPDTQVAPAQAGRFLRQLSVLVRAGVPLLRALESLGRQAEAPGLRALVGRLADAVRAGNRLSDQMAREPRAFAAVEVAMTRAGEAGGTLAPVLARLAAQREQAQRLRRRLWAATAYPLLVMLVAAVIVAGLLLFVVPRFQEILATQLRGQPLPPLTQAVIGTALFLRTHALAGGVALAGMAAGLRWLAGTGRGRRWRERLALALPLAGPLARRLAVAGFARTLAASLESGVALLPALALARNTAGNGVVARALSGVIARVKAGDSLAGPLRAVPGFHGMPADMIEVGEESGALPEMLLRLAEVYEEEVDATLTALVALIEPALIVVMAVVVGTLVLALFLPIVRIIQLLG
jgi:type IV pilus assembly protein PilC